MLDVFNFLLQEFKKGKSLAQRELEKWTNFNHQTSRNSSKIRTLKLSANLLK